jgi:hypothetical protein
MVKGEMISYPVPEGLGAFYRSLQQSNNYELIIFTLQEQIYMASGVLDLRRSVHRDRLWLPWRSSWLPGVLLGFRMFWALMWSMSRTILREVASWRGFT